MEVGLPTLAKKGDEICQDRRYCPSSKGIQMKHPKVNRLQKMNCIDRFMRAAARFVGCIPRFGHVSEYMHDILHWLPPQQRIFFRISSLA